jgi:hypothetical protein
MKRLLGLVVLVLAAVFVVNCGGKTEKSGPVYPACEAKADCADHGEVCVDKMCRECGKDGDCKSKGTCLACKDNKCVAKDNCCLTDKDCAEGLRCVVGAGKKDGTCQQ